MIGSVKIKDRTTMLNLYYVHGNIAIIGITDKPSMKKAVMHDKSGDYFVHGCNKYYLRAFGYDPFKANSQTKAPSTTITPSSFAVGIKKG